MGTHPIFESDFDCLTEMFKFLFFGILIQITLQEPRQCSDVRSISYAIKNHKSLDCFPQVQDFSCFRKSRSFRRYIGYCSAVLFHKATYNGKLKTSEPEKDKYCFLHLNVFGDAENWKFRKSRRSWKNECYQVNWNPWQEWSTCNSLGRTRYRRRSCNRDEYKTTMTKRERSQIPTYARKCSGKKT